MASGGDIDLLQQLHALKAVVACLCCVMAALLLAHIQERRRRRHRTDCEQKPPAWKAPPLPGSPRAQPGAAAAAMAVAGTVPGGCVLNVLDFGAKGDDQTDCTAAIQKVMAEPSKLPMLRLVAVPFPIWLCTQADSV